VLENNMPIDCKWYLTNQLSKPLIRIFEPILGDSSDVEKHLLQGDHCRKIFIPTPTARPGSLMMFAKKMASCVGCKGQSSIIQFQVPIVTVYPFTHRHRVYS